MSEPAPDTATLSLPRRTLALSALGAFAVASLLFVTTVLPAEYHLDPTGLGRATGIARLWAPAETTLSADGAAGPAQHSETVAFRQDRFRIPVGPGGRAGALEFKVHMQKGSSLVYSWRVNDMAPGALPIFFRTELHGHTVENGKTMTVVDYRKAQGFSDAGALTAPITGVHGWYIANASNSPVTMELRLAGFYTLIPAGQVGNERGIQPLPQP